MGVGTQHHGPAAPVGGATPRHPGRVLRIRGDEPRESRPQRVVPRRSRSTASCTPRARCSTTPTGSDPGWTRTGAATKIDYLRDFRFTLAAENGAHPGYTTEKIVDAFLAGSVPIYWGDPLVDRDFNPAVFVNFADHATVSRTVEAVLDVEADPAALARLRAEPPMTAAAWGASGKPDRVVEFLERVLNWRATAQEARAWRRRVARLQARHWAHVAIDRLRGPVS